MTEVAWMVGVSLIGWLAAWGLGGSTRLGGRCGSGYSGPLVAACVSWVLFERTHRRPGSADGPDGHGFRAGSSCSSVRTMAVLLKVVRVSPVPFVVSFKAAISSRCICSKRCVSNASSADWAFVTTNDV